MLSFFGQYKKGIIGSLISAGVLAFSGYFFNEVVFPDTYITGTWTVYVKTLNTGYRPFKNLTSIYVFDVIQMPDNVITGRGEKVRDINPDGSITKYETVQRDRANFKGMVEQHKFGKANVDLAITNIGQRFTTTSDFTLTVITKDSIIGTFTTTVAHGSGTIKMIKNK